jgi:hypothetical protein
LPPPIRVGCEELRASAQRNLRYGKQLGAHSSGPKASVLYIEMANSQTSRGIYLESDPRRRPIYMDR